MHHHLHRLIPMGERSTGGGVRYPTLSAAQQTPVPVGPLREPVAKPEPTLKPLDLDARTGNALRPATLAQMVGQQRLKTLMARIIANTRAGDLPHMLLAGQSGTGKTTLAQVVAHESGRRVFQIEAPISVGTMEQLRTSCHHGDVVIIDECHLLVQADRRGISQAIPPEGLYLAMEDHRLATPTGMVDFPRVAFIGCTTDVGLLPEALVNRFPLQLTLDHYTPADLAILATANAIALGRAITPEAAAMIGLASGRSPRRVNTFIRNAVALTGHGIIDRALAHETIVDLNGYTLDGLSPDAAAMLRFLLRCRRTDAQGNVKYTASVNTIATALGHSRDTKAIALFVESVLIADGYVVVTPQGRALTDTGIQRAVELSDGL